MAEDAISFLDPIEPLTFNEAAATLTVMETAIYNSALDAAAARVLETKLTGDEEIVALVRPLLQALAAEIGGMKL